MVKRNSFTKFMMIVCGIVLMTAIFSGCTDADAPETLFNEQAIQKLLDDDTPINDVNDMIKPVAEQNNYDVDVVKSDSTGEIVSIGVDDGKGNHVRFINDDANPDVDRATLNGKQIYPATGEATSTQTQLSGEPSSGDNSAIRTAGGYTLDDLFGMARNDPYEMINMPIEDVKLTGLGKQDSGKMYDDVGGKSILEWHNPTPEIIKYKEEYNENGELEVVRIKKDTGNWFSIYDELNDNDIVDGKISSILFKVGGGERTEINAK